MYIAGVQTYAYIGYFNTLKATPPLYGIYAVDELTVDGQVRPPLFTDRLRWHRFVFDRLNRIGIVPADGSPERHNSKLDLAHKSLQLTKREDPKWKSTFTVETPAPEIVTLNGEMDGKKIQAKLRKLDTKSFLLNSRGFRWINENSFNR